MNMAIKRLHYFDHQFLLEGDFTDEQNYHIDLRRRLNRLMHTFGIAEGLVVTKLNNNAVRVSPGVAIDSSGREMIVLPPPEPPLPSQDVDLSNAALFPANSTVFITIAYQELQLLADQKTNAGVTGITRFTEQPVIQAVTAPPPTDGSVIRLATFQLDGSRNVPGNIGAILDGGVRQTVLTKGGLVSIDGVSNPGGNVDLVQGAGIIITPDPTNRNITIAASATQGITSVDGVLNPGGNIDLVNANAITIVPNDGANTITIGESHSARTDNPHNTTAAQIGALLATAYDLRQRAFATATFSQANATGATQTLAFTFQPRLVLVTGLVEANLGGRTYGGGVSGFAVIDTAGTITQRSSSFGVTRFTAAAPIDWLCRNFVSTTTLFTTDIADNAVGPPAQRESLTVAITSLTATGFVVTFTRTPVAPAVALANFTVTLHILGLG
jgi:hypothetical protein